MTVESTTTSSEAPPTPISTETQVTEQKPSESVSLLNEDSPKTESDGTKTEKTEADDKSKPAGAPEKYSDFKLPDGFELQTETMTEATGVFKELGLTQVQAQKLVDFYGKTALASAEAPIKHWQDTQKAWRDEIKADPEIGGKLGDVKATIGKAYALLGDAKLVQSFRDAMDLTGAGNNPAFVKTMFKLASMLTEGGHVAGSTPKPKPGSAAEAMYPNLAKG